MSNTSILNETSRERRVEETVVVVYSVSTTTPLPTYTKGKTWIPQVLRITYHRLNNNPWTLATARLAGRRLKKDGSPGEQEYDSRVYSIRKASPDFPQWAMDAVVANFPVLA